MARPVAVGRDRLGQLGGSRRYGIGVAGLSAVSAEFNIGLADCMIEWIQDMTCEGTGYVEVIRKYSAGTGYCVQYNATNQRLEISLGNGVGSTAYNVATTAQLDGRRVHGHVFMDRSANAYAFIDGALQGSVDISARAADNQDTAAACQMFYDGGGFWASPAKGLMYRVFNFGVDAGPSAADMATIAAQRFVNPDAEVALLSGRVGYATERRLDVTFVDISQDGTTVDNPGTGPDLTIGGGLRWRNVRTQAERAAIAIPGEDWYCLDSTHLATNGAADLGCVQGSYVIEAIYQDLTYVPAPGYVYAITANALAEQMYLYRNSDPQLAVTIRTNGVYSTYQLQDPGYAMYGRVGLHILHDVYDADTNLHSALINGQRMHPSGLAVLADLTLAGNTVITFGRATARDGLIALRLWNAASLPADYATIIRRRVTNPWTVTDGFTGMTLRANYECKIDTVQPASSTTIRNRAQDAGHLTISGASTVGASFVKVVSHV